MHSLWYNILYYHNLCTIGTITQVTWQDQKDKSIRLSHRQKDCLANYTSDVYMWACHSHSVNHSTTASQYKRQQWAQFVEAKKRIETQNWYFSYLTKSVYSLHKEMTLQNGHTVIALQQVWWGTIVDHYGQTYKWKGLGLPAWLDNCFTNWTKRVLMSAVVHLEQQTPIQIRKTPSTHKTNLVKHFEILYEVYSIRLLTTEPTTDPTAFRQCWPVAMAESWPRVNYLQDSNTDFNCIYNTDTSHNELNVLVNHHSIHLM